MLVVCFELSSFVSMSSTTQQQKLLEQLRVESQMPRMQLSKSLKEFVNYVNSKRSEDPFLVGIDKKQNPFQEKNSCVLL